MYNKEMIKDFINYGIIAIFFLLQPYTKEKFIILVTMLIFDLIHLYILERKEGNNAE